MFPLLQYFDILWKCLLGPLLEPLYKKCFLQLVTESGMTRALTGTLPSSALREAPLIPVLLIFNLLFPNPCLALPSPFPSRPPLLCGKISRNLVVCSPGHHQVVLQISPKYASRDISLAGFWTFMTMQPILCEILNVLLFPFLLHFIFRKEFGSW